MINAATSAANSPTRGLSQFQVLRRQESEGFNELPTAKPRFQK